MRIFMLPDCYNVTRDLATNSIDRLFGEMHGLSLDVCSRGRPGAAALNAHKMPTDAVDIISMRIFMLPGCYNLTRDLATHSIDRLFGEMHGLSLDVCSRGRRRALVVNTHRMPMDAVDIISMRIFMLPGC